MENPFKMFNKAKPAEAPYEADPKILEMVKTEARKISPDASDADITGASIRAMRAAETMGQPFTAESFGGDTSALDSTLNQALNIQTGEKPSGILVADEKTGQFVRNASSEGEVRGVIEERQEQLGQQDAA
jgi:hypothetical protein